jgi:hypothetical protein
MKLSGRGEFKGLEYGSFLGNLATDIDVEGDLILSGDNTVDNKMKDDSERDSESRSTGSGGVSISVSSKAEVGERSGGSGSGSNQQSVELFSQAQEVYAAGLADGKLRHWATSATPTRNPRRAHDYSDALDFYTMNNTENTAGGTTTAASRAAAATYAALPRMVDLHGFPLSVAEAVIDHVFKDIREQLGSSNVHTDDPKSNSNSNLTSAKTISGTTGFEPSRVDNSDKNSYSQYSAAYSSSQDYETMQQQQPPSTRRINCPFDIHIIVGRGHHVNSSGTRGVLRIEIKEYLRVKYGMVTETLAGNDGCLVVDKESINEWLRTQTKIHA